jgi:hypothetical protein
MEVKQMLIFALIALSLLAIPAHAETPLERCFAKEDININTMPIDAKDMWHATRVGQPAAIWTHLAKGKHIDSFVEYVDKKGVKWVWGSALDETDPPGVIKSGWVKRSQLHCTSED